MTFWALASQLIALAGLVSVGLTPLVRRYALRAGVIDRPNSRSSHVVATPRGGGLAILAASSAAIAVGGTLRVIGPFDAMTLAVGAWTLGIVGWIDDRRSLGAKTRIGVHFLVAAWTLYRVGGLPVVRLGASTLSLRWTGYAFGAIGLVWSINLFNFMDGIDGLAGSQAFLILVTMGVLLLQASDRSLGLIALVLGAASLGFLPWNWPPARIFLGDVGSGPMGYLIASIAVQSENRGEVPLLVATLVSAAFIVDATVTLIRRMLRRERLSQAHRSHAYQRLARSFGSHVVVSLGAAGATTLFAVAGVAATYRPRLLLPALLGTAAVLAGILFLAERREPMVTGSGPSSTVPQEVLGGDRQRLVKR